MVGDDQNLPLPPEYTIPSTTCKRQKTEKFKLPEYFPWESTKNQRFRNLLKVKDMEGVRIFWVQYIGSASYFQIPDIPIDSGTPLFNRNTVLYLTPIALLVYYKSLDILRFLMKTFMSGKVRKTSYDPNRVCFATNVAIRRSSLSDIHEFIPFSIATRCEVWKAIPYLLLAGWKPHEMFMLTARRCFSKFKIFYVDYLDYALAQLTSRPSISIAYLIYWLYYSYHENFNLYKFTSDVKRDRLGGTLARRMLRFGHYVDKSLLLDLFMWTDPDM